MSYTLAAGEQLNPGDYLESVNGLFRLHMLGNGNLVVTALLTTTTWVSETAGHPGSVARLQPDGNFVVIKPGNHPVPVSDTAGNPGSVLKMQDDGNVVIYAPGNVAIWSTRTDITSFELRLSGSPRVLAPGAGGENVVVANDSAHTISVWHVRSGNDVHVGNELRFMYDPGSSIPEGSVRASVYATTGGMRVHIEDIERTYLGDGPGRVVLMAMETRCVFAWLGEA